MSMIRMSVGGPQSTVAPLVIGGQITDKERYFLDFETYLMALHGFALVADASTSGTASPYRPQDLVVLGCKQAPEHWVWTPAVTVALLTKNIPPPLAFLERVPCARPPASATLNLGALAALLYNFGQALATNYYERNLPALKARYGTKPQGWPAVWDFGRVVRNAMSHGGKITIANVKAAPVQWRGLHYASTDNGLQILHTDLWPGDLFNLILDMDAAL